MNPRYLASGALLAFAVVTSAACGKGTQTAAQAQAKTDAAFRLPWGDPDLQGIWDSKVITPIERSAKFADREFLTDQEVAAMQKSAAASVVGQGRDVRAARGSEADVEGAYNNIFSTGSGARYVRSKRTSLITDPPNGKFPPLTEEGKAAMAARRENRFGAATENGDAPTRSNVGLDGKRLPYVVDIGRPNDNPEDRNDLERCRGAMIPCIGGLCGFSRIVQAPGYVTIYYEQGHGGGAYRTVPTNGRPHLPPTVQLWLGDSVGHWEGETLIVDTTNFTDQTAYRGLPDGTMHLIERFKRITPNDLLYQVTVEKPKFWERPVTMELNLAKEDDKKNQIYESACYEGNYALTTMLAGQRAAEKKGTAR